MTDTLKAGSEKILVEIPRGYVETRDVTPIVKLLEPFTESPVKYQGLVRLIFYGYDDDIRHIWEIPNIKYFYQALDERFPYLFWFLDSEVLRGDNQLGNYMMCIAPGRPVREKVGGTYVKMDTNYLRKIIDQRSQSIIMLLRRTNVPAETVGHLFSKISTDIERCFVE